MSSGVLKDLLSFRLMKDVEERSMRAIFYSRFVASGGHIEMDEECVFIYKGKACSAF